MSELKTLAQHDAEITERAEQHYKKLLAKSTYVPFDPARALPEKLNGLACPTCGQELWDSSEHPDAGSFSIFSRKIHCKSCNYAGWRKSGY